MDLKKSPKALLKDLSKVLLDSSKALEAARKRDCETESGSSDCEEDILKRADAIQKSSKSCTSHKSKKKHVPTKKSKRQGKDKMITVPVCKMKCKGKTFVAMKSSLMDVSAKRSDSYKRFSRKAAEKLEFSGEMAVQLFKMTGAKIEDEPLLVNGKDRAWTIGNYLCMLRKSAKSIKLGVGSSGRIDISDEEGPSTRQKRHDIGNALLRVLYFASDCEQTRKVTNGKSRQVIWSSSLHDKDTDIGVYQPEYDDYEVLSIDLGDTPLLSYVNDAWYNFVEFAVKYPDRLDRSKHRDLPMIVWQSSPSITVESFRSAVTLYCIASNHGCCSYHWRKLGETILTFPSSPVIYINGGGLYQCTVKSHGLMDISSRMIRVHCHIDSLSSDQDSSDDESRAPPAKKRRADDRDDIEEFQGPGVSNYDLEGNQEPLANLSPMSTRVEDTNPKVTRVEDTNPPQAQPHVTEQTTARSAAVGTNEMREFTEDDLMRATENFSPDRKLGQGGFGTVFRGYINGTNVAVKKLTNGRAVTEAVQKGVTVPEQYTVDGQLNCEMWALTRCRHKNLVDLAGYCSTPPMLVYEYMEEGNLYCRMFKAKRLALSWCQRSCILKDVCRGLSWLHAVTPPVIHGDIKMTNILLDRHLTAKLGDFGFSKEFAQLVGDRSVITAAVVAKSLG